MSCDRKKPDKVPRTLRVVDAKVSWEIEEALMNAVIAEAVWSAGQRPGIWQSMIEAVKRGAAGTKEGTANAFFFRAMVDRLLEEFQALDT